MYEKSAEYFSDGSALPVLIKLENLIKISVFISVPPSLFSRLLGTVPRAPITTTINVTHKFYSFFSSLAISWYLSII